MEIFLGIVIACMGIALYVMNSEKNSLKWKHKKEKEELSKKIEEKYIKFFEDYLGFKKLDEYDSYYDIYAEDDESIYDSGVLAIDKYVQVNDVYYDLTKSKLNRNMIDNYLAKKELESSLFQNHFKQRYCLDYENKHKREFDALSKKIAKELGVKEWSNLSYDIVAGNIPLFDDDEKLNDSEKEIKTALDNYIEYRKHEWCNYDRCDVPGCSLERCRRLRKKFEPNFDEDEREHEEFMKSMRVAKERMKQEALETISGKLQWDELMERLKIVDRYGCYYSLKDVEHKIKDDNLHLYTDDERVISMIDAKEEEILRPILGDREIVIHRTKK